MKVDIRGEFNIMKYICTIVMYGTSFKISKHKCGYSDVLHNDNHSFFTVQSSKNKGSIIYTGHISYISHILYDFT